MYQTFHARLCEFSLQSALFTAESVSQPSAATAVCMSSTESALFGFDIFLPISKVHLSTMICTARWQSSFCLWENPSVHIDSWSRSWMVDSFFAPISWWSISQIQAFTQTRLQNRWADCSLVTIFYIYQLRSGKLIGLLMIRNVCMHLKLPALGWQQVSWLHSAKGSVMRVAGTCWRAATQPSIYANQLQPIPSKIKILRDCERQV